MSCGCEEQCTCTVLGDGETTQVAGDGSPGDPFVVSALPGNELPAGTGPIPFSGFTLPAGFAWADGGEEDRTAESGLFNAITFQQTGNTTSGMPEVTGLADTSDMFPGVPVEGANIPAGTTILSVDSPSQITLSANATANGPDTLRFLPFGDGNGTTTFNKPDPNRRVIVGASDGFLRPGESDGQAEAARSGPIHTHGTGGLVTASAGAHTHTVTGSTGTPSALNSGFIAGLTQAEIDCIEAAANAQAGCSNVEGIQVNAATSTHTHTVTGATNNTGNHTHTISGDTASDGPSYLATRFIIKL